MLSKAKIKRIRSLSQSKFRKEHGLFVAEGTTNVLDLLQGDSEIYGLFATADWIGKYGDNAGDFRISEVDERELKQISNLKNPSDVLGVFHIRKDSPFDLATVDGYVLMLDDIRDPGNLGTIIRTADWFGISDIVCSQESVDVYNPKVVQASMGSIVRVQVHYENLEDLLITKPEGLFVYGAVLDGTSISAVDKPGKGIFLIGNEAHGISQELLPLIDHKITIPGFSAPGRSAAESLNASIATAVICYEFRR
jgi:TrmH family RNA methyltransferase